MDKCLSEESFSPRPLSGDLRFDLGYILAVFLLNQHIMGDPGPRSIASRRLAVPSKVSQVDADDLDDGLVDMIGERVHRSLGQFGVSRPL